MRNQAAATILLSLLSALLFPWLAHGFAGGSKRVFVGTPVSTFPKHLVSDRMTQNPKTLHPDEPVDEAINTLVKWGVSGAPVVDDRTGKYLLGVVSAWDFLQKEAFEGAVFNMEGSSETVAQYIDAARRICGKTVADIMTPNPRTVSPNTPMRVAAEIMATEKMHHLPVVDDKGHLMGILTPSDVMKDLVHVVWNLPAAPEENKKESSSADVVSP